MKISITDLNLPKDVKGVRLKPEAKSPAHVWHKEDGTPDAKPLPDEIGYNYALALDYGWQLVDFDSDHPERIQMESQLPPTWSQKTLKPSGVHYLYRLPEGVKGEDSKLIASDGTVIGDLKSKGLMVGPGTTIGGKTYTYQGGEPQSAPMELIRGWSKKNSKAKKVESEAESVGELSGIPNGCHDTYVTMLAGYLHGQFALDWKAVASVTESLIPLMQGMDSSNPYTREDCIRVAKSICSKEAGLNKNINREHSLLPQNWRCAYDLETTLLPVQEWLVYGFIPKGQLSSIYGRGGIGKSTFASWLTAKALLEGLRVGYCGMEEPYEKFLIRANQSDLSKTITKEHFRNLFDIGQDWHFPTDIPALRSALRIRPLDFIYLDSLVGNFDLMEGANAAEKSRAAMGPLAALAQEFNMTIVGTFHTNKEGKHMGSTEMLNVGRHTTELAQKKATGELYATVVKSNLKTPDYCLTFTSEVMPLYSLDGEPCMERDELGKLVPHKSHIITGYKKGPNPNDAKNDEKEAMHHAIRELKAQGMSNAKVADTLSVSDWQVRQALKTRED